MNKVVKVADNGESISGKIQLREDEKAHWKKEETWLMYT